MDLHMSKINFVETEFLKGVLHRVEKLSGYRAMGSWSNGLVVKALDSQSRGPVFKTTGWLQGRLSLSSLRGR